MSDEEYIKSIESEIDELREWKRRYTEAAELWDALDPGEGQHVVSAVLVGKLVKVDGETAEDRAPTISISSTDDVDWMDQMGILDSAYDFIHTDPWQQRD